jgi:hypothetical protein
MDDMVALVEIAILALGPAVLLLVLGAMGKVGQRIRDGLGWVLAGVIGLGFLLFLLVLPVWLLLVGGTLLVGLGEGMMTVGRWLVDGIGWLVD